MSVQILIGDALAMLKTLPDESVHCIEGDAPLLTQVAAE